MVRFKNRWVLIEILGGPVTSKSGEEYENHHINSITAGMLHNTLKDAIAANYGEYGLGCVQSSLNVKYFSNHTNIGILRVSRDYHQMLLVSLFFIKEINGSPCYITVRHIGGTILKAQRAAIQYDLETLLRRQQQGNSSLDVDRLSRNAKEEIMKIES
ncbi:hypothetical protein K450DRAFT_254322 [Umbelopsis ramanniana AG]|uniref:Ribonuclease P/MRP protein subunit POP5 n=1 Tax=Umbelopsis ramanniana AG TaxID=1314678 RepID=A0AAD5E5Y7_UMBRA|nr:uncharacterized protein K450DRAFT_254322 [Umbelopsis ramanniana AG]KAI8576941.1 hypothetical protein K450DRAFT_254322 [Umbelopsis ramanniana AG]